MSKLQTLGSLCAVLTLGAVAAASAQQPAAPRRTAGNRTAVQPKITRAAAARTALARVPNGKVKTGELEREHGRLVYSFDITAAGKSGVEEVVVDAMDGSVVSVTHEDAAAEAREAAAEHRPSQKVGAHRDSAPGRRRGVSPGSPQPRG